MVKEAEKVKMLLEDARDFFGRGLRELEDGIKLNDQFKIRDAAEKLWNATISATNALILHFLNIAPASHWERRKLLEILEDRIPEVEKLGFRDRYGAREKYLHETTFYDGIIDIEMLGREAEKVRKHIDDIERIIASKS